MAIVNSRHPTLDHMHDPSSDFFSPKKLLSMKTSIVLPEPGNFVQQDLFIKMRWRRVQYLVNLKEMESWIPGRIAETTKADEVSTECGKGEHSSLKNDNATRNT